MNDPAADLEARVARLEAREELARLVAAYCTAVDAKDAAGVAALFSEQGGLNDLRGPSAVQAFFERWMAETGPSFHYPHAQVVEIEGEDSASGTVSGHAEQQMGGRTWVMGVRYRDRYRREAGAWRFEHRLVEYVYRLPVEDYARRFGEVDR